MMMTVQYPGMVVFPGYEWGLGWYRIDVSGEYLWGHTGGLYGVSTYMYCDPIEGYGYLFLSNSDATSGHYNINNAMHDFARNLNSDPVLSAGEVTPAVGYYGTRFEFTVDYYDANGSAPSVIYVNIDGTDYDMALDAGTAADGSYLKMTRDIAVGESHEFYFYAENGNGGVSRMPAAGTLSGPLTFDPELFLSGVPAHGAWMTVETWGAVNALWGVAWSSGPGPFYLPASGLTYDIGPGDLHMVKRLGKEPLYLDEFGYGTTDFRIGNQVPSGTKYIQGTTKMNAFWGKTNRDTFEVP
jgi:hypothetical protein